MEKLLKLHEADNTLTVLRDIQAREHSTWGEMEYYFPHPIKMGHKVASCFIEAGEKIIKYGVSIGSATKTIQRGDHVHLHNMKSDFLPKLINTYENQSTGDLSPSTLTNQPINQVSS